MVSLGNVGQRSDWRERLKANPSRMEQELAIKLEESGVRFLTQVETPVTTADLYFSLEPRPSLVFVDGRVHLGKSQRVKDEELGGAVLFRAWPGGSVFGVARRAGKRILRKRIQVLFRR